MKRALLPLLLAVAACAPEGAPETESTAKGAEAAVQSVPPETAVAQAAGEVPIAVVPATISLPPGARMAVTTPFSGSIAQIEVQEGDAVRQGQRLATMVSREAMELAAARARADARLKLAEAEARRVTQLAEAGIVAGARNDAAQAALAEARVEAAQTAQMMARGGAAADGLVHLKAPIAGRVSRISVETGGPVEAHTAPFVIDAVNRYSLELQLPERLAGIARPGMAVELAGGFRGTLVSVSPGVDPKTRSVRARASIGAAPGLVSGQALSVTLMGNSGSGAAIVPSAALTRIDGRDALFVQAAEGFAPRTVRVGSSAAGRAVILEGVKPGETVAISGLPELKMQAGS